MPSVEVFDRNNLDWTLCKNLSRQELLQPPISAVQSRLVETDLSLPENIRILSNISPDDEASGEVLYHMVDIGE